MITEAQNDIQAEEFSSLSVNIQNLYIGQIIAHPSSIQVKNELRPASFWGEILIYGTNIEGRFEVEQLGRVALYGSLLNPDPDDPIGVLSLVGPLVEPGLDPDSPNLIKDLFLKLHYRALSVEREPRYRSEDAVFPEIEQIVANLDWTQEGQSDDDAVQMNVNLLASQLVDPKLGYVPIIDLKQIPIKFYRAGTEEPRGEPKNTLDSHCGPPVPCSASLPATEEWRRTVERRIAVKFVNFALTTNLDVEAICKSQIAGVRDVWRKKAALDLTVWPNERDTPAANLVSGELVEGDSVTEKPKYSTLNAVEESELLNRSSISANHVKVYLVDTLSDPAYGGGITYDAGEASAYCILELNIANSNPQLLAHELGHVLGLDHPNGTSPVGSAGSVLASGTPNPDVNTCQNLRILKIGANNTPYNSIVCSTGVDDCFDPDLDPAIPCP